MKNNLSLFLYLFVQAALDLCNRSGFLLPKNRRFDNDNNPSKALYPPFASWSGV